MESLVKLKRLSMPKVFCSTLFCSALSLNIAIANAYSTSSVNVPQSAIVNRIGNIETLVLTGDHYNMGFQYGQAMNIEMQQTLSILENFYITQKHLTYSQLLQQAALLYNRFPVTYQKFIQGVAAGAGISLGDEIILNGMETLGELLPNETGSCAFISISPQQTAQYTTLIGRNYDYPPPFDQIAQYLTVTIMNEDDAIPTAFVALPGQIYCPSCMNASGLFMELNNGTPSGGSEVDTDRQSLLANMLEIMQNSSNLSQMEKQLNATQSDFSLIVNTADTTTTKSYEYSSTLGMNDYFPTPNTNFASTNFYLNPTWQGIPIPTDTTTWMGVTRRNNLLNLANTGGQFSIANLEVLMDKTIDQGGGKWDLTIYQIIFDPRNLDLYLQTRGQSDWTKIALEPLFNISSKSK